MCQRHQSQLVQLSLSCSTAFSILLQGRDTYPSFHILSILFCGQPGLQSRQFCRFSIFFFFFFLLIIIRSDLLAEIRWSVCMPKSQRSLCVSFSRTGAGLCIYHLLVWSNLNFLHISQWITLPTQSFIMWLIVSSLSQHSLHLLFCWVLSILALIWLVLMALPCAAIRRDSASLLRLLFLSQVQVFSCEMVFISRLKQP